MQVRTGKYSLTSLIFTVFARCSHPEQRTQMLHNSKEKMSFILVHLNLFIAAIMSCYTNKILPAKELKIKDLKNIIITCEVVC